MYSSTIIIIIIIQYVTKYCCMGSGKFLSKYKYSSYLFLCNYSKIKYTHGSDGSRFNVRLPWTFSPYLRYPRKPIDISNVPTITIPMLRTPNLDVNLSGFLISCWSGKTCNKKQIQPYSKSQKHSLKRLSLLANHQTNFPCH